MSNYELCKKCYNMYGCTGCTCDKKCDHFVDKYGMTPNQVYKLAKANVDLTSDQNDIVVKCMIGIIEGR